MDAPQTLAAPLRRGWSARARRALPWLVAATILVFLFRRVSVGDALGAAAQARLELFVPAALVAVAVWFLLESTAFAYLFTRFNAPLSRREARSLRAVTYLLTPINWNLGTAAVVLHLRRSKGIPALDAGSSLLLYGMVDGIVLGALVLGGVLALPASPTLEALARAAAFFVALQVCLLGLLLARGPRWSWLERLRRLRLFRSHRLAHWGDAALLLAIRSVYFAGFVLFFWAGAAAFHVQAPITWMAAVVPIVLMVASVPITPAGLGTQQAAMVYLLAPYGSEAQILAFGLAFPVALTLARMPIGLLYIRDLGALRASVALQRSA